VDDSAFARTVISNKLQADPDIRVIGGARDGVEALEMVKSLRPDVITLDVTMPRMDGLAALERIMIDCPTPVIMLSALTGPQTQATIKALEIGAVDFFLKTSLSSPAGTDQAGMGLTEKIKVAAKVTVIGAGPRRLVKHKQQPEIKSRTTRHPRMSHVIVIGSSTGGPKALGELIPALPRDLPAGILIVQHMPPGFTRSLADRLNNISQLDVREAQTGDTVKPEQILVAPGGRHMKVTYDGTIVLDDGPLVCGVRPSVDVTIDSAVAVYGSTTLGVVLTGMGQDGKRGASLIKGAGGKVAVEAESTCAVYGMPKSVADAGYADAVVPLPKMAQEIIRMCQSAK
jgi:two-component system chemotaxis response regulator CheB